MGDSITVPDVMELDWGWSWIFATELDALRHAYDFRETPHGVEAKRLDNGNWQVTVFNHLARAMGITAAKA